METIITEVKPLDQQSFYGKALSIKDGNITKLQSYTTIVAEYNRATNEMKVFGWYSRTTAKHINAFLVDYGFDTCSKAEMESYNDNV